MTCLSPEVQQLRVSHLQQHLSVNNARWSCDSWSQVFTAQVYWSRWLALDTRPCTRLFPATAHTRLTHFCTRYFLRCYCVLLRQLQTITDALLTVSFTIQQHILTTDQWIIITIRIIIFRVVKRHTQSYRGDYNKKAMLSHAMWHRHGQTEPRPLKMEWKNFTTSITV